jgi:hypothetical protein
MFGGFSATMQIVGERYDRTYDAVAEGNHDLANSSRPAAGGLPLFPHHHGMRGHTARFTGIAGVEPVTGNCATHGSEGT